MSFSTLFILHVSEASMGSKKKRNPLDDAVDVSNKKARQPDGASTSHTAGNKSSKIKKPKIEVVEIPSQNTHPVNDGKFIIQSIILRMYCILLFSWLLKL